MLFVLFMIVLVVGFLLGRLSSVRAAEQEEITEEGWYELPDEPVVFLTNSQIVELAKDIAERITIHNTKLRFNGAVVRFFYPNGKVEALDIDGFTDVSDDFQTLAARVRRPEASMPPIPEPPPLDDDAYYQAR